MINWPNVRWSPAGANIYIDPVIVTKNSGDMLSVTCDTLVSIRYFGVSWINIIQQVAEKTAIRDAWSEKAVRLQNQMAPAYM